MRGRFSLSAPAGTRAAVASALTPGSAATFRSAAADEGFEATYHVPAGYVLPFALNALCSQYASSFPPSRRLSAAINRWGRKVPR